MTFVVDVSADLYGFKENVHIDFETRPYLGELKAKIESVFQIEATRQCPAGETPALVRVRAMSIYDDNRGRWDDLLSCDQLFPGCQIYAFQHGSEDRQAEIPASSPPRSRIVVPSASPRRAHSGSPGAGPAAGGQGGYGPAGGAYGGAAGGYGGGQGGYGGASGGSMSPQREQALGEYDLARRKADQARMDKELAEQHERHAWDRLAQTPN
eukprot:TRINITY_DN59961_c0_g1_i1.p1 TRINITY_DN59961_c0_g1~~TRINITY_DN59961_c0_g1_i1.p1  ORF type:complete len:242 (+),score=78.22 TRINITY_DN59961_c0_g1_i1:94-726(+)